MLHVIAFLAVAQAPGAASPRPVPASPLPTASPVPSPAVALPGAPSPAPSGANFQFVTPGTPVPVASPDLFATPSARGRRQLVAPPAPAIATVAPTPGTLPPGTIAGNGEPFVGLSLPNAIGMALARDTDLAVSQSNRRIAGYRIVAALGAYDLQFQLVPTYQYQQIPPISTFQTGPGGAPAQVSTLSGSAQVVGRTTSGGNIQAGVTAQRIYNSTQFQSFNPYYETAIRLLYTQPFGRGFGIDETREQIELARINADLSTDTTLLTASNAIDNVSVAYDNLISAWKNVAIQEDALRQAKAQSESNARLVRRGQSAAVDVVESDEQVNEFQDNVFSAIQGVATAQNQLKQLILNNPADPAWTANLVPTTPVGAAPAEPSVDDVIVAGLRQRPEVAQLRENLRSQDVTVAFQRDQTKPQIDLQVGVTENGLAGVPESLQGTPLFSVIGNEAAALNALIARANAAGGPPLTPINVGSLATTLPANSIGNIGTSFKSALAGEYPVYQISATVGLPLRNQTAVANYQAALEQRRQLVTQEVALVQRVQTEARNAVQQFRSARSRLLAAGAARLAAEKVAASEVRKFRAGESTTYLVLQRQVQLANERLREVQAQTDVQNALVELDRVSGSILAKNAVDVKALGNAPHGNVPDLLHGSGSNNH